MRVCGLCLAVLLSLLLATGPVRAAGSLPPFDAPELVGDLRPGEAGSSPHRLVPVEDGAVFLAVDDAGRARPWRTDGTPEGTFPIGPADLHVSRPLYPVGAYVWFIGRLGGGADGLWRTDGTVAGTVLLAEELAITAAPVFHPESGLYFFDGRSFAGGGAGEPWVRDGAAAGTRRLVELVVSPHISSNAQYTPFGERVYFLGPAEPPGEGGALWATDGTAEGTEAIAALGAGDAFRGIVSASSRLWVTSGLGGFVATLWTSDGTAAGTTPVRSFGRAHGEGYAPGVLRFGELPDGRTLWRIDTTEVRPSLWVTDGTAAGTRLVRELGTLALTFPAVPYRNALFYLDFDFDHGLELWRTDGTPEGTRLAVENCPGSCSGFAIGPIDVLGDRLILDGSGPAGVEPVVSDGTPEGTVALGDLCPGSCWSSALGWIDLGGALAFSAIVEDGPNFFPGPRQIWATDLTPEGTRRLTDFAEGSGGELVATGGRLLFDGDDGALGAELWSVRIPALDPLPPPGPWLRSAAVPGFEVKMRIAAGGEERDGRLEPACIPETACFSGALPGRSEVFVRVVGPRPNGFLWPTLVKFTTSEVEVWIRQLATGVVRYYRLPGARPGIDELPGLFDRTGFQPAGP